MDLLEGPKATVTDNWSSSNSGAGLALTKSPNAVIKDNVFAFNGLNNNTYRIGAGIRIARDEDINNEIVGNLFWSNREAGILGSNVVDLQREIDRNLYYGETGIGLIWDGYLEEQRSYKTIPEIQQATGWETNGERRSGLPISRFFRRAIRLPAWKK